MRTSNMLTWLKFSMAFVAVVSVSSLLTANDDEKETKLDDIDTKPGMMRILAKRVNEVEKEIAKKTRKKYHYIYS